MSIITCSECGETLEVVSNLPIDLLITLNCTGGRENSIVTIEALIEEREKNAFI